MNLSPPRLSGSWWACFAVLVFGGCSASPNSSQRQLTARQGAKPVPNPRAPGEARTAATAGSCPTEAPVVCPDQGCCPEGSTCANGGCERPPVSDFCPSEAPVACGGACAASPCVAEDSSGMGNHATLTQPAKVAEGRFGTGVSTGLTGATGESPAPVITGPANGLPIGNAPVTIEAWVRTGVQASYYSSNGVFGYGIKDQAEGDRGLLIAYVRGVGIPGSVPPPRTNLRWSPGPCTVLSPIFVHDGEWHFLAVVYDGASATFYVDGVRAGACHGLIGTRTPGGGSFSIGNHFYQGEQYPLVGEIDEVRVLNFAATPEQIAGDFSGGSLPLIPGTVGLWHFDEGVFRCCPSGSTCGGNGSCGVAPIAGATCPSQAPTPCGGGFCCPTGTVCLGAAGCGVPSSSAICNIVPSVDCGNGWCCSGQDSVCFSTPAQTDGGADGGAVASCCPSGTVPSSGGGECSAPPREPPASVPPSLARAVYCGPGRARCGAVCCPLGTTCNGNYCIQASPSPRVCSNGTLCGESCCPTNYTCSPLGGCVRATPVPRSCPPEVPVQCAGGGACCKQGFTCSGHVIAGTGQVLCQYTGSRPPRIGAQGPACGTGLFCAEGNVCPDPASPTCCTSDHPQICGETCCLASATCSGGQCACPAGETLCGDVCCGAGVACVSGRCEEACPSSEFPNLCGTSWCCAPSIACQDGDCACPQDHPVACVAGGAKSCCLPGAVCEADGCGCPEGRTVCGELCCAAGQQCQNGRCGAESGGGGTKCPDGRSCSLSGHVCCKCSSGGYACLNAGLCNNFGC